MTKIELLAQRQSELEEVLAGVEEVTKDGKTVKYRSVRELRTEIQQLETDIALESGKIKFRTKARSRGSRWL
ncbi:MAG: hypothetical protein JEZ12_27175 [Desulfobacterium sp.]|nr:hypothetical protein [Desulfobacterium sp.]